MTKAQLEYMDAKDGLREAQERLREYVETEDMSREEWTAREKALFSEYMARERLRLAQVAVTEEEESEIQRKRLEQDRRMRENPYGKREVSLPTPTCRVIDRNEVTATCRVIDHNEEEKRW